MRKIFNLLGPLFIKYRYRKKPDPFQSFKTLRRNEILEEEKYGNILILPIRVAPVSNLFEGVYGYAMKLRGYSVHALFCNQTIRKCENMSIITDSPWNCSLCNYEQKRFAKTFLFESHSFNEILSKSDIERLRNISLSIPLKDMFSFCYNGVLLGHHIKSAVLRYLLSSECNISKNSKIIREFAFSTLISFESTKKLLTQLKPKFVLSSHGVYSTWGGALEACKLLGIPVIVWGRGYIDGNIIVSRNESYLYERVYEPTKYWKNLNLSNKEIEKVTNYFLEKRNPYSNVDHINYYKDICVSNKSIYEELNLNKSTIKFGLFPNIPWDGTTFSSSKFFPTLKLFLETTINWFRDNPQCELIIRQHPAEKPKVKGKKLETVKDLIDSISSELPHNIHFLKYNHPISSYKVEEICDCSLMYASTMSLEIAFFGKTVIETGQSNARNKGIIFEAKGVDHYIELLNRASNRSLYMDHDMKKNAIKYAYHWIFRRHIPETIYEHKSLTFTKYNITSSMDLAPGKNKIVDWFINKCLDGEPFIWNSDE